MMLISVERPNHFTLTPPPSLTNLQHSSADNFESNLQFHKTEIRNNTKKEAEGRSKEVNNSCGMEFKKLIMAEKLTVYLP